jgi:hypothetical protein
VWLLWQRSFYFQEEQARKGKEKIEERKRMQQLIKAAIEVDIIDTDIPYIRKLIEDAKRLQGRQVNDYEITYKLK